MKKVTLIALMAILCLSGMAQKKKGTARKTVSKNIVINFNAQGELGIFALRGPVKECVWTTKDQTRKLGFDRNGMWTSENGNKPWFNYGSVKRDNKGRIIQMGDGEETGQLFTYNNNGLLTKLHQRVVQLWRHGWFWQECSHFHHPLARQPRQLDKA